MLTVVLVVSKKQANSLFVSSAAARHVRNASMCVIINSIDASIPEPGDGAALNPVAAEREFIVVLFRLPGELLFDDKLPGRAFILSATLN